MFHQSDPRILRQPIRYSPEHPEGAGMTSLGLRLVGLPGAKRAETRRYWPLTVDHPLLGNHSGAAVPPERPTCSPGTDVNS